MESVFYEFETQKNMDKVDIIRKHIGNDDFYDINGTPLLTKILSAMDEYAQQQVKNCSIPAVSGRSEQLCDFLEWYDEDLTLEEREMEVKTYMDMKSHNCH